MKPMRALFAAVLLVLPSGAATGSGLERRDGPPSPAAVAVPEAARRLRFEENRGQSDPSVRFVARARGYTGFLTDRGLVLALREGGTATGQARRTGLSMEFVGGGARPVGVDPLPCLANYLIGRDPSKWVRRAPSFGGARAREVWPGVDAAWTADEGHLRYSFRVGVGADPSRIVFRFVGAESIALDDRGDLLVETPFGTVRHSRPVAWQGSAGTRRALEVAFRILPDGSVGFRLGRRDPRLPVTIDPRLTYSTYLGGTGTDVLNAVAHDAVGNIYLAGDADSATMPIVGGFRGQAQFVARDVYVAQVVPGGSGLKYATYFGGSNQDYLTGLAVTGAGAAWICGHTLSSDLPVAAAFQGSLQGQYDGFVARISPAGDAVQVCSYFGGATGVSAGTPGTTADAVALDSSGSAYIVGTTSCTDLPTKTPFQAAHAGQQPYDGFVAKFTASGGLAFSSYLGGSTNDFADRVSVDDQGRAVVFGRTAGGSFPNGGFLGGGSGGGTDVFLARVSADGMTLEYAVLLGGSMQETAGAVEIGPGGTVYLVGTTHSSNFPVVNPIMTVQFPDSADSAAFLARVHPAGTGLLSSTRLGANGATTRGLALAVDAVGAAWVGGDTDATSFFPLVNAPQTEPGGGNRDAYVMRVHPAGTSLLFSSYFGFNKSETILAMTLFEPGYVWCAGTTTSTNFPSQLQPQATFGGGDGDGFLACITTTPLPPGNLVATAYSGSSVGLTWTDNSTDEQGFLVQRRDPGGEFATVVLASAGQTLAGDAVSPLTEYEYRVASYNADGQSPWSNVAIVSTPELPPAIPGVASAVPLSADTVRVTWVDNSHNETSFEVLFRRPGDAATVIAGLPADSTTYDVTGLLPGRTYGFSVRSRNAQGASPTPADVLAATLPTAGFTLVKGTLKASSKPLKDKAVVSGVLATNGESPDGVLDPVAEGLIFRLGGEISPMATVTIPATSPGWTERKGKFTWKSSKGVVPKVVVTFIPTTGALTIHVSKIDFAASMTATSGTWFVLGDDAGIGSADWQEAKPGSWRFPAK